MHMVYDKEQAGLKNLFVFNDSVLDIKGFADGGEFAATFPFVPYQFIIIQKVLAEIASMATPASTSPAVSVPCSPASRRLHRRYGKRWKMLFCPSICSTIPYILFWRVPFAE